MRRSSGWLGAQHTNVKVYPTQISDAIDSRLETTSHNERARASGLGRGTRPASTPTESAENQSAQRRHGLGRSSRNPASDSHGRRGSGVHCLVARRGGCILVELSVTFQSRLNFPAGQQNHPWDQYRARRCRLPTPDTQSGRCCRCSCVPVAVQISSHRRAWRCLLVPGARRRCSFSFNCRHRP